MIIEVLKPSEGRVYLDHNATTPPLSSISLKVSEWLNHWGNASSIHWSGRGPKTIMREARETLAASLGCHPLEIVFTSGGSEANNLILRGTLEYYLRRGRSFQQIHFITTTIEHPSIKKTMDVLETLGVKITRISVSREGVFDWEAYEKSFTENTVLVSMMLANNETGTILPLSEIVKYSQSRGVRVHTDAVQALGKISFSLSKMGVDYASFSAHKFHALKGVGWLYVKKNSPFEAQITGGSQERHRRGGTENILALRSVLEIAPLLRQTGEFYSLVQNIRNHFESRVKSEMTGVKINSEGAQRLPNTSSLIISGVDGETLLMRLDLAGFAVSTGAACSSGSPEPSPVLLAMGFTRQEAQSSLRVSLGWENTLDEINQFVDSLKEIVTHLRNIKALEERAER